MKKMWSMPERIVNYIKIKAEELELSESEFLRRIVDEYKNNDENNISMKRSIVLDMMHNVENKNDSEIQFKKAFRMLLNITNNIFDSMKISDEYKSVFFQNLKKNVKDWEDKSA